MLRDLTSKWNLKQSNSQKQRAERRSPGPGSLVKGTGFGYAGRVSSGGLLGNVTPVASNTVTRVLGRRIPS